MAVKDAVITLKGSDAAVRKVEIIKDSDGNFKIAVYGETNTSVGKKVGLDVGLADRQASNKVLSDVWDAALPVLRAANGLE